MSKYYASKRDHSIFKTHDKSMKPMQKHMVTDKTAKQELSLIASLFLLPIMIPFAIIGALFGGKKKRK